MSDTTTRWQIKPAMPKLVPPWKRQPPAVEEAPPVVAAPVATSHAEWEQRAIEILARPIEGESSANGHARKESELKAIFATLSIAESRALHARLSMPKDGDELARLIGRLVVERRTRLIAFVADARRREAVMAAGGR